MMFTDSHQNTVIVIAYVNAASQVSDLYIATYTSIATNTDLPAETPSQVRKYFNSFYLQPP